MALRVTSTELQGRVVREGINMSADLKALIDEVAGFERVLTPSDSLKRRLRAKFDAWYTGNHPGELQLLLKPEPPTRSDPLPKNHFRLLVEDVQKIPGAPKGLKLPDPPRNLQWAATGVIAALWSVPNHSHNFRRSTAARLHQLDRALARCQQEIVNQSAKLQQDNAFLGIFAAPEYYFTKQWAPNPLVVNQLPQRQAMSDTERLMIKSVLVGLSQKYPKILIVPGSIFYEVALTPDDKIQKGFELLKVAKERVERERAEFAAKGRLASFSPKQEVLSYEMQHKKADPNSPFHKVPSLNKLADTLLDKTSAPMAAHNTVYVLLGGQILARYDKHTDFYETKSVSADKAMFVPGTQDQCPEVGNSKRRHRLGVEICFDHANGVLKRRNPSPLSFHVVVSDHVTPQEGNMAMTPGGWFLHASTDHTLMEPATRGGDGIIYRVGHTHRVSQAISGPEHLDIYWLNLPEELPPPVPPRPPVASLASQPVTLNPKGRK